MPKAGYTSALNDEHAECLTKHNIPDHEDSLDRFHTYKCHEYEITINKMFERYRIPAQG